MPDPASAEEDLEYARSRAVPGTGTETLEDLASLVASLREADPDEAMYRQRQTVEAHTGDVTMYIADVESSRNRRAMQIHQSRFYLSRRLVDVYWQIWHVHLLKCAACAVDANAWASDAQFAAIRKLA